MSSKGNVMFAFLLGGAVGAALALLYAPQSGAETRRKIKEGAEGTGDWAREKYDTTKERVSEGIGKVRDLVEEKREDVRAAYDAGKEAYHKGKERLFRESVSEG